jgi:hypothetical protein
MIPCYSANSECAPLRPVAPYWRKGRDNDKARSKTLDAARGRILMQSLHDGPIGLAEVKFNRCLGACCTTDVATRVVSAYRIGAWSVTLSTHKKQAFDLPKKLQLPKKLGQLQPFRNESQAINGITHGELDAMRFEACHMRIIT